MCDRSSDPTEHDAARTPLSALDRDIRIARSRIERIVERDLQSEAVMWAKMAMADLDAILARLTEPDAGEGTANTRATGTENLGGGDPGLGATSSNAATAPLPVAHSDDYQRGYTDGFRQLFEDMTSARLPPDTTEATLRAALIGLAFERRSTGELCWCGQTGVERHFPECLAARAALQQPAVQPEGGPE